MAEKKGAVVTIIGAGGAETALAIKHSQSPHVSEIHVMPGNSMMPELCEKPVTIHPEVDITNWAQTTDMCHQVGSDLVEIRNERAIQAHIANNLRGFWKIPVVGPNAQEGSLETDKDHARSVGQFIGLPQPSYTTIDFKYLPVGRSYPTYYDDVLEKHKEGRYFVKAAGLFDGKGVIEANGRYEIEKAIQWLRAKDPVAAEKILIESPLEGEEVSTFANIDNYKNYKILGYAQDHKRAFDGDRGPNTGGMGAVGNPLIAESKTLQQGAENIVAKVARHVNHYRGTLYPGLMAKETVIGLYPSVVEFNCRWGDPEAQAIIPGLNVDFFELGMETANGTLRRVNVSNDGLVRVVVAIATNENFNPESKTKIRSIRELKKMSDIQLFGARVDVEDNEYWIGGAGRVFFASAAGKDVLDAREKLAPGLEIVKERDGANMYFREDIGWRDIQRLRT